MLAVVELERELTALGVEGGRMDEDVSTRVTDHTEEIRGVVVDDIEWIGRLYFVCDVHRVRRRIFVGSLKTDLERPSIAADTGSIGTPIGADIVLFNLAS